MADIELVIKISEDAYKATCDGCMLPPDVENVVHGIKNGTPLPKGHDRLIEVKRLKEVFRRNTGYDYHDLIDIAPTIIEVDKAEREDNYVCDEPYCSKCGRRIEDIQGTYCAYCGSEIIGVQTLKFADNDTAYGGLKPAT